ncbi:hypothetical protein GZH47_13550 [Paenibacillus rhizovicinus]|uniref:Uncharacterized protein n=1 Tax=Paenibacillus rhizovicinus TaxID=2704463 RepID=A0A6C0P1J8_9BACL|nr:hypothetical protein [Paenibacillus rhizovicinus]QHW31763.1 hypothetical protein GZH47_13550 [Paenibacillus rhizovicinus]
MNRLAQSVPFGYEPSPSNRKGTMVVYDTFQHLEDQALAFAAETAEQRAFAKLVLYPLHEETVRRMTKEPVLPYHKRLDRLHDWKRSYEEERGRGAVPVAVEGLEGKRKKYTPMETALRHLADAYPSPLFLYLTPEMANQFASFSSFEEWIVKLRLLLTEEPQAPHPRLVKYSHRWDAAERKRT